MWFVVKGWLGSDDPAVLDHALHAHNTRVDRGDPAIAVLSIGYRSLGSCSRAAGWSAATLCVGTKRTWQSRQSMSALRPTTDMQRLHRHVRFVPEHKVAALQPPAREQEPRDR